jgi:hypothetical protein
MQKIKTMSLVAIAVAVAAAFYFSRPDRPVCGDNILISDVASCDVYLKGSTK